jgi:hypothetical protein
MRTKQNSEKNKPKPMRAPDKKMKNKNKMGTQSTMTKINK